MTGLLRQFSSPAEGLAFEAKLFSARESAVGLWASENDALVCPASYRKYYGLKDASSHSLKRGWPVFTRPTGGGAVPQGSGVVNLAIAFTAPRGFTINDGYRLITGIIRNGLGSTGVRLATGPTPTSFCDGDWNLSIQGKKVVGTAQRWKPLGETNTRVLAHALILTRGSVEPGARAVDAFNADLGLGAVSCAAHTSLERAIEKNMRAPRALVQELHAASVSALRSIQFEAQNCVAA
ncbi:lipoyl protein ligase domain-containing protein [Ruegeria arenilitoris]|uniref:lipoyl protein ligase domain-containing protein n=1 Tax=Ruegeria arenilitoris TaxID=1173585 RepID=UPI00147C831B|nr:hypothetical protein [Ruegeria arenilitoris]